MDHNPYDLSQRESKAIIHSVGARVQYQKDGKTVTGYVKKYMQSKAGEPLILLESIRNGHQKMHGYYSWQIRADSGPKLSAADDSALGGASNSTLGGENQQPVEVDNLDSVKRENAQLKREIEFLKEELNGYRETLVKIKTTQINNKRIVQAVIKQLANKGLIDLKQVEKSL